MCWIVCQIGAREHFAVARALVGRGALVGMLTEAWVRPGSLGARLSPKLGQRFHPDLATASVHAWNYRSVAFEIRARLQRKSGWSLIMARNQWFQRQAVRSFESLRQRSVVSGPSSSSPPTAFAYSYAALEIFRWAKAQGWRTVLGQIDPGPVEERIVAGLHEKHRGLAAAWRPVPPGYWVRWREECRLADCIVINSEWSRAALLQEGVPPQKLKVVPLAYEADPDSAAAKRAYPEAFSPKRPLRILFLGQINLRKGMAEIFEAIRALAGGAVEFWLVGPVQVRIPEDLRGHPQVRWIGPVSRARAGGYYREADVFLLPTHSDGFALTQLEALSWGLPLICSRNCGEVVDPGVNGLLLPEVSAGAIVEAVRTMLAEPGRLAGLSTRAQVRDCFALSAIGRALLAL